MYHQGTVRGSAVRAASLLALAGAGLFGLAATAGAAGTAAGAAGTAAGAAGTAAGAAGTTGAIPVGYSCSLAAYGQDLAPLNIPAALSAESTGLTVTVKLVTQPVQVPAATASALPQLSYLDIAGTASANGMSGSAVNLSGQSGYLGTATGGMTQLPAMTASGSATQTGPGLAAVEVPPTLTLTPVGSASAGSASAGSASAGSASAGSASPAQQAPLTCTTSSATTVQVTAAAGTATGAPGQTYTCTVTVGSSTTTASRVPMSLTATGPATVGMPDMVTLSAPASTLGSAFPVTASPMSVSGVASLGGTYAGSVPMTGLADTGNGMFRLTGPWMPTKAGMASIFAPHTFAARLREQTAVTVAVTCTAATATTTTTQVMVQAAASTAGTATASAPAAAPGAPNTGGGGSLHPGSDLPLAAAGAAAVLAGLAITLYTLRRRRGLTS